MKEYCVKNQEKARDKADDHSIDYDVAVRCTGEYPSDWEMFIYCVDKEHGSKLGFSN